MLPVIWGIDAGIRPAGRLELAVGHGGFMLVLRIARCGTLVLSLIAVAGGNTGRARRSGGVDRSAGGVDLVSQLTKPSLELIDNPLGLSALAPGRTRTSPALIACF